MRMNALALCLLTCAAPAVADDRGYLTALLEDNLSGAGREVTITGFAGALSSQASIEQLTIADAEGIWLTLNGVALDWSRSALLRGVVDVTELSAREIIVARRPVSDETGPAMEARAFALPELPVSISIGRLAADRIDLGPDVLGEALEGRLDASVDLVGGEGRANLVLERTDDGPAGKLMLDASFVNATGALVLDLTAEEDAGGIAVSLIGIPGAPSARLAVAGSGPISDFSADVSLQTDGQDRLGGTIALQGAEDGRRSFDLDLAGDLAPLWMPDYAEFFGDTIALKASGDTSAEGVVTLRALDLQAQAIALAGQVTLAADGLPLAFDLTGRIGLNNGTPVLLPLSGENQTRVRQATLAMTYDRTAGEGWSGRVAVDGLDRSGLAADQLVLDGSGRIWRRDGVPNLGATLDFAAEGLRPDDPALAAALGSAVAGKMLMSWQAGGTGLKIPLLTITGDDYGLTGRAVIDGLDTGLEISGQVKSQAGDLSRLSALAGRPLAGAADIALAGSTSVLTGAFDIEAEVTGQDITLSQTEVDRLLAGTSRISLSAARTDLGTDVRAFSVTAGPLRANLAGSVATAGSDVTATFDMADLSVLGSRYSGALNGTARVTGTAADSRLVLDAAATNLGFGQAEADRLLRGTSVLAIDLAVVDGQPKLNRAEVANPQVTVSAASTVTGNARAIDVTGRLADLALLLPDFPGALTIAGTATEAAQGYALNLRAQGPGGIDARIGGTVAANGAGGALKIEGAAQAGLANAFLAGRLISGPVRFDLGLDGPFELASLSGRVSLTGGRLADPAVFFALQDLSLTADLAGSRAQLAGGGALTSGGRVTVAGSVGLQSPFAADLRIGLAGAILRDPQLFETTANGEISVTGPVADGGRIGGEILLTNTEVQIPSTGLGNMADLPGLIHLHEPADVRATRGRAGLLGAAGGGQTGGGGRPIALDLLISAPSQIYIRGRGLDAELGGTLRLGGTTASVQPSGAFSLIRGRLDILGRRLTLSEASLALEGNFVPMLAVAASTQSDGITSFVRIDGPATEPVVSFTSTPQLPEEEVLARLLFGRGIENLSALQAAQLASAVATLAGRGGVGIINRLRTGFGLDDLDVQTDSEGGATVRAGKYLSENVYSEVQVDGQGQSQINLNLDLSPSVTVRGSAGSAGDTGLGIFFEKDY
jgi:translocation and assembly module TamB